MANKSVYIEKKRKKDIDNKIRNFKAFISRLTLRYSPEENLYLKSKLGSTYFFFFFWLWITEFLQKCRKWFSASSKTVSFKAGKAKNKLSLKRRLTKKKKKALASHKATLNYLKDKPSIRLLSKLRKRRSMKPELRKKINAKRHKSPSYLRRQERRRTGVSPFKRYLLDLVFGRVRGIQHFLRVIPSGPRKGLKELCFSVRPWSELSKMKEDQIDANSKFINDPNFQTLILHFYRFDSFIIDKLSRNIKGAKIKDKESLDDLADLEQVIVNRLRTRDRALKTCITKKELFASIKNL